MKRCPEPRGEPEEPMVLGCCAWCGHEVYEGELSFLGEEGRIHGDCLLDFLERTLGLRWVAEMCGYEEAEL